MNSTHSIVHQNYNIGKSGIIQDVVPDRSNGIHDKSTALNFGILAYNDELR